MSLADKITRLTAARDDIRIALNGQGINASEHGFEDFANDISSIETNLPNSEYIINVSVQEAFDILTQFKQGHLYGNVSEDTINLFEDILMDIFPID